MFNISLTFHCSLFVQAILCGNFWYKEYGLVQCSGHKQTAKDMSFLQQKAFPLLERLKQVLEDKQPSSFSPNACNQHLFGTESETKTP